MLQTLRAFQANRKSSTVTMTSFSWNGIDRQMTVELQSWAITLRERIQDQTDGWNSTCNFWR